MAQQPAFTESHYSDSFILTGGKAECFRKVVEGLSLQKAIGQNNTLLHTQRVNDKMTLCQLSLGIKEADLVQEGSVK